MLTEGNYNAFGEKRNESEIEEGINNTIRVHFQQVMLRNSWR